MEPRQFSQRDEDLPYRSLAAVDHPLRVGREAGDDTRRDAAGYAADVDDHGALVEAGLQLDAAHDAHVHARVVVARDDALQVAVGREGHSLKGSERRVRRRQQGDVGVQRAAEDVAKVDAVVDCAQRHERRAWGQRPHPTHSAVSRMAFAGMAVARVGQRPLSSAPCR
eukprot:CAMPEP_0206824308 /NCGR_PEP_ID=MMETSP0975-20121206/13766_1 /ASSEMBLY_ACC=CAM_ASM_000399 /TAXON_ID=483370 /ORGANISM="non described non described, Strain CCMP2097" /LENGTH=167 /DNA_ID=CAMNT_0054366577 /DNA_START=141 /DNA_END=641 /DNA_ORIENTATION=-